MVVAHFEAQDWFDAEEVTFHQLNPKVFGAYSNRFNEPLVIYELGLSEETFGSERDVAGNRTLYSVYTFNEFKKATKLRLAANNFKQNGTFDLSHNAQVFNYGVSIDYAKTVYNLVNINFTSKVFNAGKKRIIEARTRHLLKVFKLVDIANVPVYDRSVNGEICELELFNGICIPKCYIISLAARLANDDILTFTWLIPHNVKIFYLDLI